MPTNYSGLNVSTNDGEGAANVMQWGAVDRAANQLYQQQLYRRQLAQQNYLQQQGQFERELGKVRSVDIPDVVSAYNNRKQLRQQILFDKNLHKDPVKLAQTQLALSQADKDYYGLVNGSKETMDFDKNLSEDMAKNHDLYNPNAHTQFMQWQQMPTSKRREMGLLTPDPLLYNGQNTDWGAITKASAGEPQEYVYGKETPTPDNQKLATQYYKRGNQPEQFKELFIGQLSKRQASQDATKKLSEITNQDYSDINKAYDAISPEEYKRLWGKEKPNLDPNNPDNAADVLASYSAKKYALTNAPIPSKIAYRDNEDYKFAQQKELQKQRFNDQMALAKYNQGLKKDFDAYKKAGIKKEQGSIINKIVDDQVNKAVSDIESRKEVGTRGYYTMLVPPTILAAFQGSSKNAPIRLGLSKDKQHVFPVYEHLDQNGIVDGETIGDQVPIQEYKTILADKFLSQKDFAPEIESEGNETGNDNESDEWDAYKVK